MAKEIKKKKRSDIDADVLPTSLQYFAPVLNQEGGKSINNLAHFITESDCRNIKCIQLK
jgi:hypothetical protein